MSDLAEHPETGWTVDPSTGAIYGAHGRWKGKALGCIGTHGYRVTSLHGRAYLHHRVVWEACVGPIPQHMVVNHLNGDKLDNRLANLEVVTSGRNNEHAYELGLKRAGMYGPRNGNYRVTPTMRAEILARRAGGETRAAVARAMGVCTKTIWNVERAAA